MKHAIALTTLAGMLATLPALAGAPAESKVDAAIRAALLKRYPTIQISAIEKAPIDGLYAVYAGQELVYSSPKGDFLLTGAMIETSSGKNMSQELQDVRNSIDFSVLPLDKAIKIVKGNGERVMAVFSDPDCPFCQKLERELAQVTDTTVYVFLYPLAELHPQAPEHAKNIWCSAQPDQTWARWMLEKTVPAAADCATSPVKELAALGDKLKIDSTPTVFFPNGRRLSGAPPAAEIVTMLKANAAPIPKAAKN